MNRSSDGRSSSMTTTAPAAVARGADRLPSSDGAPVRQREAERAADAHLALQPHPAAEQLDDAPRQGEPEPGALLARAAAAALLERLEDPLPVGLGHADPGVGDRDGRSSAPLRFARTSDRAAVGVNLTAFVTRLRTTCLSRSSSEYTVPTSAARLDLQRDAVCGGPLAEHRGGVVEQRAQVERRVLELHPAGLDLRQVEDLVEQLEQVLAGARGCRGGTPPGAR